MKRVPEPEPHQMGLKIPRDAHPEAAQEEDFGDMVRAHIRRQEHEDKRYDQMKLGV